MRKAFFKFGPFLKIAEFPAQIGGGRVYEVVDKLLVRDTYALQSIVEFLVAEQEFECFLVKFRNSEGSVRNAVYPADTVVVMAVGTFFHGYVLSLSKGKNFFRGNRLAEIVSLNLFAAYAAQKVVLLLGFNALRESLYSQSFRHLNRCADYFL